MPVKLCPIWGTYTLLYKICYNVYVQSTVIGMRKKYYIDSENVGDDWISLLDSVAADDEIIVFYTDKSPHMNYNNLILLKNSPKEVTFIKCFEGTNALDFQLCTEIGLQVHDNPDVEFLIVSNDTGYDAAVKYLKQHKVQIKRIKGADCSSKPIQKIPVLKNTYNTNPVVTSYKPVVSPLPPINEDEARAKDILYIVGRENLSELHTALQQIFGATVGNYYYKSFKTDVTYDLFMEDHKKLSLNEKRALYCKIVFAQSETNLTMPNDFPKFVTETWKQKKNLNSFRASLQAKYGKDMYEKYYSIIKAHIKILDKIK